MGREIRRVPAGWEHPLDDRGQHLPMLDRDAEEAFADWTAEYQAWLGGEHDRVREQYGEEKYPKAEPYRSFCAWNGGPPNPKWHRPKWKEGTATCYQAYQNTSEGTPLSPVFATREEMVDWLVNDGGGMGIGGVRQTMSREAAERFVGGGYAPTMIFTNDGRGLRSGLELLEPDAQLRQED